MEYNEYSDDAKQKGLMMTSKRIRKKSDWTLKYWTTNKFLFVVPQAKELTIKGNGHHYTIGLYIANHTFAATNNVQVNTHTSTYIHRLISL